MWLCVFVKRIGGFECVFVKCSCVCEVWLCVFVKCSGVCEVWLCVLVR